MKLAAVILNYNDAKGTVDAVKRIAGFSCFSDIIVVDNASTDNSACEITVEIEKAQNSKLHFIINDKNGGYGFGNNAGVRYAYDKLGARLAVIANPDAVFEEALIVNMQRLFEQDKKAAAVGAVMLSNARISCKQPEKTSKPAEALSAVINYKHNQRRKRRYIDITPGTKLGESVSGVCNPAQETFTYDELVASGWMRRSTMQCMLNSGPISRRLFKSFINYPENYYKERDKVYTGYSSGKKESRCNNTEEINQACVSSAGEHSLGNAVKVYAVHGSLLMVSTDAFMAVGGYDENMFLYGEENVLAEKLWQRQYSTYLLKQGYEHAGSVSITGAGLKAVKRQQLRNASENYYCRHYLGCDESGMNIVRLFQRLVLAETRIASGLHLI